MRFFLSGFVALLLQIGVYALLIFSLLPKMQKQYTFQDYTQVELIQIQEVIDEPSPKLPPSPPIKKAPPPTPAPDAPKTSPQPSPVVGSNVKKLFEKIDSFNPPVLQENIEDERPTFSSNALKRQEYSFNQDASQVNQAISRIKNALDSLWENELQITLPQRQDISEGEYDEWFAKIKEILYTRWESVFYESVAFVVSATINTDGSFSYRIVRYSKNQSYNLYMEEMLNALKDEKFPPYPRGRITLEIVYKTKEHANE